MANKRKRNDLSLADKFEVVKLLEQKTMSQTEIAKKLGCSQGQVSNISQKRDEIRAEFEKNANPDRKRQRSGKASDVEGALSQWFIDARARDIPLSGPILAEKAADLAKTLGKTDFNPTSGWLSRWKGRNNISYKKLHGEKKDADLQSAANWIDNVLPGLLNQYDPADVYNAVETGLYFRALPDGTLTFKTDDSGGSKKSKERVTALVACNMTGSDKRKLLIVGKSKDPRCFRGQRVLPVTYTNSGNAWMTGDIFRQWLKDFNRDMGRQKRKILLLIDNCSAHPQDAADHLPNIQMEFLPPNTTSVIQPCDQGIIRNLKGLYRREVVRKIIADIDDTTLTANEMARKLSLLDAVHLLSQAWTSVKQQTIANCYRAAGFTAETGEDPGDEIIPPPPGMDADNFASFVSHDDDIECHATPTDEEICAAWKPQPPVWKQSDVPDDYDDDEPIEPILPPVLPSEARAALTLLQRFIGEIGDDDANFQRHYEYATFVKNLMEKSKKQSKITEFIKWIP